MKKYIVVLMIGGLLLSCAPKRMSCYGKRCVETHPKKDITKPQQATS